MFDHVSAPANRAVKVGAQVTTLQPQPYRLNVPDEVLEDLRERLGRTRWPDEIPESVWQYGSNLAFMRRLTERWRDGVDWRTQEAKLNTFDQFQVPMEGINLHFIH
jgi:epoxide hydrolase